MLSFVHSVFIVTWCCVLIIITVMNAQDAWIQDKESDEEGVLADEPDVS